MKKINEHALKTTLIAYKCTVIGFQEAYNEIQALCEAAQPCWIPVSERLPEVDGDYLVYYTNNVRGMVYFEIGHFFDHDGICIDKAITLWMPLPPKPEQKTGV